MNNKRRLLTGAMVLTVGRVSGYAFSFVRNLILARMLTKADYGLAAAFGMTVSLLEVTGKMAFGSQVIQSKHGDSQSFQSTAHTFQLATGLLSAAFVAMLAVPFARAFDVPSASWAFACLALVPVCRSLEHLDNSRQQRRMNYLPVVLCESIPQLATALAAWPLAVWIGDYRVILWLILSSAVLRIGLSHLLAERPFRWSWDPEHGRAMIRFGWPLLLNGLLLFASQQGDQFVIGAGYSLEQLASYSLAFSLVSIPWYLFSGTASSLMLPMLARVQDEPDQFRRQYQRCVEFTAAGAVALFTPLLVAGEQVVLLAYGPKYHGTGTFVAVLGAAFAVRFIRFAPALAAMARADTINQLYSNLGRAVSLPLALGILSFGGGPLLIAACALVAEVLATAVSLWRLSQLQGVPLGLSLRAAVFVLAFVGLGAGVGRLVANAGGLAWSVFGVVAALVVAVAAGKALFPDLALMVAGLLRKTTPSETSVPAVERPLA